MGNTILTHQMVARESAAMLLEYLGFISNINRNRQKEFGEDVNGFTKGSTVKVKVPPAVKVFDGAVFAGGGAAPDLAETYVNLTITTQKHVPLRLTSLEKALSMTDYKERFLKPAISTLASVVQADFLTKAYKLIPNVIGTAGTIPSTSKTYQQARAALERHLAPSDPRYCLFSSDANTELVDATKVLFQPTKTLTDAFLEGYVGKLAGLEFFECQSMPIHTNGNKVASVTTSGTQAAGTTLNIKAVANADTFKAGTVFTIAGIYEVHPLTGATLPNLRQFVVTADATMTGTTGSLSIYPAMNATAPGATISALPADGTAITFVGAASTGYRQNIVWQRDAFATAFVPLKVIAGCDGYTYSTDEFAVRVMTGGDFANDAENTRIDVLYADPVAVRPDHAVRVTE
jgi:hypothetical protein